MSNTNWDYLHYNLSQNGIERLYACYESPFTVEVREQLKFWIEENLIRSSTISNLDPSNPSHHELIVNTLHVLVVQIEEEIYKLQKERIISHSIIVKLNQACALMKKELAFNAVSLYLKIRRSLNIENGFMEQARTMKINKIEPTFNTTAASPSNAITAPCSPSEPAQLTPPASPPAPSKQIEELFPQIGMSVLQLKSESVALAQILPCIYEEQNKWNEDNNLQNRLDYMIKRPDQYGSIEAEEAQAKLIEVHRTLAKRHETLAHCVKIFVEKSKKILRSSVKVQNEIEKEVLSRRRESNWLSRSIDVLHGYCSDLAEVLFDVRAHLTELQSQFNWHELVTLNSLFEQVSIKLQKNSLVVESQPCQVIKKNTKFNAKLRFLLGSKNMAQYITADKVTAHILSTDEVKKLVQFSAGSSSIYCKTSNEPTTNGNQPSTSTKPKPAPKKTTKAKKAKDDGALEDHSKQLELLNEKGETTSILVNGDIAYNVTQLQADNTSATFDTPRIARVFKREKPPGKSVLDFDFWIVFHTTLTETFNNLEQKRWIWTLSNPIKLITHAEQKCHAFETTIWVNAMDDEMLFSDKPMPKYLPWSSITRALNSKCLEMTKVRLTPQQLDVLKEKAFSVPLTNAFAPADNLTFDQFCKITLPGCKFKFWEWFYEIMKLIEKHLCGPWQDGLIHGFLGREEAEKLLIHKGVTGSFLLRFSDGTLGGISIVWLDSSYKPVSIAPATSDDLSRRPLAERVIDLVVLTNLYPDKPKSETFTPYLQKKDTDHRKGVSDRYVSLLLTTYLGPNNNERPKKVSTPRLSITGHSLTPPATPYGYTNGSPISNGGFMPSPMHQSDSSSFSISQIISELASLEPDDFIKDLVQFVDDTLTQTDLSEITSEWSFNSDEDEHMTNSDSENSQDSTDI